MKKSLTNAIENASENKTEAKDALKTANIYLDLKDNMDK